MKRWFYILMGGVGVALSLASAFMLWLAPSLPPPYILPVQIAEFIFIAVGMVMGTLGFINGKQAGEFDIAAYNRASRKRDHHIDGTEIEFGCPMCRKTYRASPLLAGKPFTCRECRQVFDVPEKSEPAAVHSSHLLPGAR